jgi:magnesium-transporting ATPase (P-type)
VYMMAISIVGYFVFVLVYGELYSASPDFYGVPVVLFSRAGFWLTLILVLGMVIMLDYTAEHVRKVFLSTPVDVAMEVERCLTEQQRSLVVWGDEEQQPPRPIQVSVSSGNIVSKNPLPQPAWEAKSR